MRDTILEEGKLDQTDVKRLMGIAMIPRRAKEYIHLVDGNTTAAQALNAVVDEVLVHPQSAVITYHHEFKDQRDQPIRDSIPIP